jgi:hypothetical protein
MQSSPLGDPSPDGGGECVQGGGRENGVREVSPEPYGRDRKEKRKIKKRFECRDSCTL